MKEKRADCCRIDLERLNSDVRKIYESVYIYIYMCVYSCGRAERGSFTVAFAYKSEKYHQKPTPMNSSRLADPRFSRIYADATDYTSENREC